MKIPKNLNPNVAPQRVSVYTRHSTECRKRGLTDEQKSVAKYERRCNCPKWVYLFHDGKDYRFSATTRSWEKAEQKKQELERELDPEKAEQRRLKKQKDAQQVPVDSAVHSYMTDAQARKLGSQTLAKRRTILERQLLAWTHANGIRLLEELSASVLTRWRTTWKLAAITTRNNQEILRHFFRYCIRQDWLKDNPALLLSKVQVKQRPTDYFTREEFDALLAATYSFASGQNFRGEDWSKRLRVLLLLMRWSGLRIGDAVRLERSRLRGDNLFLYQAKTGTPVFVPLPHYVVEALRDIPPGREPNPRYFFWSGDGMPERAGSQWGRAFKRLFEIASLKNSDGTLKQCHPHMLRDTFAVEMLLAGVPIEEVSMLLGHASIKTTEKHYAPWVLARQEKLENSVKKSWLIHGIETSSSGTTSPLQSPKSNLDSESPSGVTLQPMEPTSQLKLHLDHHSSRSMQPGLFAQDRSAPVHDTQVPRSAEKTNTAAGETAIAKPICVSTLQDRSNITRTQGQQTINKARKRKLFPYADVARMWNEGKTIREIGMAIGRLDESKDPTHTMRNFLRRMHKFGFKDSNGVCIKLPYRNGDLNSEGA